MKNDMKSVVVPVDDDARPFSDSLLPEAMIYAGSDALDKAQMDMANYVSGETIDWDQGMMAVAVYRAMLAAAPAPSSLAGGEDIDAFDQELIDRGLRTIRAYDAVRFLRDALSATTTRLTGYDWNSDPEGLTKQQGDAFELADKVFADLSAAVDAHPDIELPECQSCGGTGKTEETARMEGANQHSACVRACDDCDGCGFAPDEEPSAILAALSPEAPAREGESKGVGIGLAIAAGIAVASGAEGVAREILGAAGLTTEAALRGAGVDAYDISLLAGVVNEMAENANG